MYWVHNTDEQRNQSAELTSAFSPSKSSKRSLYMLHENRQAQSIDGVTSHVHVSVYPPSATVFAPERLPVSSLQSTRHGSLPAVCRLCAAI
jgi:hypothetical protein